MRVLLDTQILIRALLEDERALSPKIRKVLIAPQTDRLVSAVSLTEIAIKQSIGKLEATRRNVEATMADLALTLLPYTSQHALRLFDLPLVHRDPFDRMLIATALAEDVPLLSGDRQFPHYRGLRVIR